jgi:TPR repeat protein
LIATAAWGAESTGPSAPADLTLPEGRLLFVGFAGPAVSFLNLDHVERRGDQVTVMLYGVLDPTDPHSKGLPEQVVVRLRIECLAKALWVTAGAGFDANGVMAGRYPVSTKPEPLKPGSAFAVTQHLLCEHETAELGEIYTGRDAAFAAAMKLTQVPLGTNLSTRALQEGQREDDHVSAVKILRPLAEQGDTVAQAYLGYLYVDGHGVPEDHVESAFWYRRAAEQGDGMSQLILSGLYKDGDGVPKDPERRIQWLTRAAELGLADAQWELAMAYRDGDDVTQDQETALIWLGKAADQRDSRAILALGTAYSGRWGAVARDDVRALMWLDLGLVLQQPDDSPEVMRVVLQFRDAAAERLSVAKRQQAKALEAKWLADHPVPPAH